VVRSLRRHLDRRSAWILLGLVLLALALDYCYFTGLFASDDVEYLQSSYSIANDGHLAPGFGNTRLGIVLPNALVWWITGSLGAVLWFHVAYHLALVPIAYVLARLLLDERAGLIAAALVATSPLLYGYAGAVLPDNAATCWFGLSMIALVATRRHADPGVRWSSWNTRRALGYFLAGAMVGFCYWCKESGLILVVPAAVFIITAGPSVRSLLWIQNGASFALGLVVVFVLELVVLRALTGQWVNRLTELSGTSEEIRAIMYEQGTTPFARFGFARDELAFWIPLSMWLLLAGAIAYGLLRARNVGIMMFFWFPTIYMTVGSTSFSEYLAPPIQGRYYAFVILPAAVMTAIVTSLLIERWRTRNPRAWTRLALVCSLAIVGVYECRTTLSMSGNLYKAPEVRGFVAALERARELYPDHPIVTSPYYSARMGPLLFDRDDVTLDGRGKPRPAPPYVYIRKAAHNELPDPDPIVSASQRIDAIVIVQPVRNRWKQVVGDVQRLVGVTPGTWLRNEPRWWAELLLVSGN
jgi:4-amino-4-deoxy-L-arabinose transferase-like glycosyltransferase